MSNKMLEVSDEKTKSEHKYRSVIFYVLIIAAIAASGVYTIRHKVDRESTRTDKSLTCLLLSNFKSNTHKEVECPGVWLETASTEQAREQGLSGRTSLAVDRGMLFEFAAVQTACMWMKDMHFPIDMVWLNDTNTIIKIERSVPPDSYPQTYCADGTKYVIELDAGVASRANLIAGKQLVL